MTLTKLNVIFNFIKGLKLATRFGTSILIFLGEINLNQYILSAENIQKRYGKKIILRDASINIKQGEIYGLIGKNGSGKTTILRIITGQIQHYGGTVSIAENKKISAVINAPSVFLNLSAFENMKTQSYLLRMKSYESNEQIKKVLDIVGLEYDNKKRVGKFSLGMTQRLKLGIALLSSPEILILDEPTNGLDPDGIADLRKLLLHLNHTCNITILISSHILNELEQTATCFGILHDGKISKEITIADVKNGNTLEDLYLRHTKGGEL